MNTKIIFAFGLILLGLLHLNLATASEIRVYTRSGELAGVMVHDAGRIAYTYDSAGNITAMAVTPGGGTAPALISDPAPWGRVGAAFSHTLLSSRTPTTFAASGLPPGLSLASSTGVISGNPTTPGPYPVTVTLTSGAVSTTGSLVIQIRPAASAPIILRQPQPSTVVLGQLVSLFVDVEGISPLSFQWRKNGSPISGATGRSFVIPAFAPSDAGSYSVIVANTAGNTTSVPARLDPLQPWAIRGETFGLPITLGGTAPWFSQTTVTYDGRPAMQSGAIGNNGLTSFSTTVTGPGKISWHWKVSSEKDDDGLFVQVNGVFVAVLTGEVDWQQQSALLSSGSNTILWGYAKDGATSVGLDKGWVADVNFSAGWQIATSTTGNGSIERAPDQETYANGTAVTLTAAANNGYYFDSWAGGATGTVNPLNLTANAHRTIAAVFKEDLGPAVEAASLTWRTGGDADWRSQFYIGRNDGISAQAGTIVHGKSSWLETSVTGPGTVSFWWKVSSEANGDGIIFTINGTSTDVTSGEVDWTQRNFTVGSGVHILRWTYVKDFNVNAGQDSGWLDSVSFTPTGPRTFSQWAVDQGLLAGQNGHADDPNRDGVPNLLAYAFGIDPLAQAVGYMPTVAKVGGNLVCTYRRAKNTTGIAWTPQTSTTLQQDWTTTGISHNKISEDATAETWTASIPLPAGGRRFLRINVTQQ